MTPEARAAQQKAYYNACKEVLNAKARVRRNARRSELRAQKREAIEQAKQTPARKAQNERLRDWLLENTDFATGNVRPYNVLWKGVVALREELPASQRAYIPRLTR